ncbi:MAG: aminopeptidase P family protein [Betaproteobacteria bacterium]|nr:aminopeptidase P family protein [Betaproteobacteria bacterium]MBI2959138.1 aminopeptidase P family protein [Betaproteobacteria bacterium]
MTAVNPPVLSMAERDRRWARARELMRERGFEALLVAGFRAREMYESYLSDDYNEGCVLFPLEGEPVVVTWAPLRVLRARWSAERGHPLWIEDYRVAASGTAAAELFAEKRLASARVGVVGLASQAPTEVYGAIPANFWLQLTAALPQVRFEDVSEDFSHMMLVKSSEELAQIRYAARAAESACGLLAEITREGVGEEVLFAEATREMLRFGIGLRYPAMVMNSGSATLSWGPPRWTTRGEAPRTLGRGDLVQAELMPMCGNQEIQVQMTVALDPIDEANRTCERVARESYEAGIRALRPGITFADLLAAMEEPLRIAGCWGYTPLVHSISPHFLVGRTRVNMEKVALGVPHVGAPAAPVRKAVLEPGMVFAFEPNACLGHHRVNIGGTVVVTAAGCEELNAIPTRVTHQRAQQFSRR